MALIKNANAGLLARDAIVLDLGDLRRQGEEIVRQARAEAARIVAAARQDRERILAGAQEQGRAVGLEEGIREGRAQGRAQAEIATLADHGERLTKVETAWTSALGEFESRREDLVQGATRDVLGLAVSMAERIVKRAIKLDAGVAVDQLAAALAVVVRPTEVVVKINPEDRGLIAAALPRLMGAMPSVKHAEIVDDAAIERGGCVVSTKVDGAGTDAGGWGGGQIDAQLGTQIDRIVETLLPGERVGVEGGRIMTGLEAQIETVRRIQSMRIVGRVRALRGLTVLVRDLPMPVGALVDVGQGERHALGEVIGFDGVHAIVMMLAGTGGIRAGDSVVGLHAQQTVGVGSSMLGRVIDGLGRPIDAKGPLHGLTPRPIDPEPISPMSRRRVSQPLVTGVRAMDLMTTLGRGQRLGIFAGPGVGKSTLLGQIARGTTADVSVVALIGERGREVKDFVEHTLGAEGLAKCVLVVATSDESALLRVRAAHVACSIAEFFREQGKSVMLLMDSITRFAHAQRQIGLSVGEPPATRGYTPSVFAALARMLERAGAVEDSSKGAGGGSITGLYSILVEGDDMTEPVADAARGILDGHVILSRKLAQKGHYPAIDVLDSISRVADDVCDQAHVHSRRQIIRLLAAYKEAEDLIQIGAYAKGSSPATDVAIRYHDKIVELLQQGPRESEAFEVSRSRMVKLAIEAGAEFQKLVKAKEGVKA